MRPRAQFANLICQFADFILAKAAEENEAEHKEAEEAEDKDDD